ncbi:MULTISPECIES: GNAT family N-acetyltransferase [unclassified Streptomyces]|uniref:GNAT family N-acetyltransferase n=1 Tax=unclassified Streptomyces TaxID=2593676 RepID=UPI00081E44E1|nr:MULTISPECIES: GNAT family N-acetyltransferase [unclassified Streptomyces]MYZ35140.1 GNAT family N-acetyltransferase [Streptomyces sp. SID4917]SCF73024.1 Predicted acetyltransferase [Streptomyces sp. MnatMP-M17]
MFALPTDQPVLSRPGRPSAPSVSTVEVRNVTDAEIPQWTRTWASAYLQPLVEGTADFMRETIAHDRVIGAFDLGQCVGTYRSSAQELTVPGGGFLPASAVSKVSVAGTHRRRGLLSRMLGMDLRGALERGEPVAVLDAAEYPIYGRFGFGPATSMAWFEIDVHRAGLDPRRTTDTGGVETVSADEYRKLAPEAYERFRLDQAGALRRDAMWWREATGQRVRPGTTWTEPFYAVRRTPDTGEVDGLLCFTAEETWASMVPRSPLYIRDLIALSPAAERALLRYAVTVDWVDTVHLPYRAPDTLAPLWLDDPRAARLTTLSDYMWLRILDVPRTLAARTYGVEGTLVLEVRDADGYAAGTWLLHGGPEGASCVRTTQPSDLRLDVGDLARLYLGDEAATRLAAVGCVEEVHGGALRRADLMFRTGRRSWSPRAAVRSAAGPA